MMVLRQIATTLSSTLRASGLVHSRICHEHRRHPEVLALLQGEPRRMRHGRPCVRPSFETPRKRAAPQNNGEREARKERAAARIREALAPMLFSSYAFLFQFLPVVALA